MAMNQKNLNYEIETPHLITRIIRQKVSFSMNQKNLNYEIENVNGRSHARKPCDAWRAMNQKNLNYEIETVPHGYDSLGESRLVYESKESQL